MAGDLLTPERWEIARQVLLGESDQAVSHTAAAKAAGVTPTELRAWITRSQERRPEDETWIWEIAPVAALAPERMEDALLDLLWRKAQTGNVTAITRLLRRLAPERWAPRPINQTTVVALSRDELRQRLRTMMQLERGRAEVEGAVIDVGDSPPAAEAEPVASSSPWGGKPADAPF